MTLPLLALLGLAAGLLTSLAGLGGGMFLLLAGTLAWGPHGALAVTAPALLVGNVHRAWLSRRAIAWPVARPLVLGAVPGALAGGLFAARAPGALLNGVLLALTAAAVARAAGLLRWTPPRRALAPAGLVTGVLCATGGGAGLLLAPVLLATGLEGTAYVSTAATVAAAMHGARLAAYGHTGLYTEVLVMPGLCLTAAIMAGNVAGARLRPRLSPWATTGLEYGTLLVCVGLAVAGVRG